MDIEKWCRLCSIEVKYGVFLFSEEAKRSFLNAKIRKYLSVSISLEDKLPKMICEDCVLKLDGFHKFASMALKNQDKLTRCILSTPVSPEPTKTENVSLLHTYLTKGTVEKNLQNNETEVMEMEVRVDPMSILQCCLEEDESDTETDRNEKRNEDNFEREEHGQDEYESDEETQSDQEVGMQENASSESENSENTCIIYLCSICKRSFETNIALQAHMYIHSSSYAKRILSFSFNKYQENVTVSLVNGNKHNTEQLQHLELMPKEDDNKKLTNSKEGDVIFKCPICARDIPTKGSLKVHLETHRPKGQYGCDICGRVFKTQCNLFRHKEYHQGVQFPCEICGRVYPTNSTLRAHSITHSDLRPHKCPLCEKTFKRNQDLKFHINQHTGARPYQCPYCPKAFASSGNCFSHRKRMHPVEVERDRERAAKIMR